MNSANRAGGIEMSWLEIAPISRFASGIVSRTRQKLCRCASLCAISAAPTSPRSSAAPSVASSRAPISAPAASAASTSTRQLARHRRRHRHVRQHLGEKRQPLHPDQLERRDRTAEPDPQQRAASPSAASGEATDTQAVAVSPGSGISRRLAAVIRPSVPSAPIRRCRRS